MKYKLSDVMISNGELYIDGWAAPDDKNNHIDVSLRDAGGQKLEARITRVIRPDVAKYVYGEEAGLTLGFRVKVSYYGNMYIVFDTKNENGDLVSKSAIYIRKAGLASRAALQKSGLLSGYRFYKANGFKETTTYVYNKAMHIEDTPYMRWFEENKATKEALIEQRKTVFEKQPKISVIVPLYRTPKKFLWEMAESVMDQSYANWELCLANGSPDDETLNKELKKLQAKDKRIIVSQLEENLGISGNTNAALAMATGEYIALLDHDDLLAPNALYEYIKLINEADEDVDMIYCDEDKVDQWSRTHFDPHFKSDFNPYMLWSCNYICHFFVVKREIANKVGGFSSEYDGAQDYDFIMKCSDEGRNVYHIPKMLYHWRCHVNSTALNPESKSYAYDSGQRALQAHYDRFGINATSKVGSHPGWYSTDYHLPEKHPLLTVMIPNKDHVADLSKCLNSIFEKSTYDNYEILIIENNSTETETFQYYEKLKSEHNNVSVITYEGEFNYAAINNLGIKSANGEYTLLLNNDTEMITPNAFEHMLGYAIQKKVAIVGGKLYFGNDTIQHAGVVLGVAGIAAHAFSGLPKYEQGYMSRATTAQNYSAVTGACMMIRTSLYKELGGFDEVKFAIAFNDLDLCLKAQEAGYMVVFDPDSEFYHYESISRGYETSPEKIERFNREIANFKEKYGDKLEKGDPYYNINFNKFVADFGVICPPKKEKKRKKV